MKPSNRICFENVDTIVPYCAYVVDPLEHSQDDLNENRK